MMVSASTPSRHSVLILALGSLCAFAPLSIDMYLPSLPTIQGALGTSASAVQLTLAAFIAGLGVGQLAYGPLSDRFGRRKPLFFGIALYILASVACAFAPSIQWLIALRFLQAVGGASGPVIARAVVRDRYSGRDVARVLSLLMLVMGVAPILAPILGGWVLEFSGWRTIFAVLSLLGVATLVFSVIAIPRAETAAGAAANRVSLGTNLRALFQDKRFIAATLAGGFAQASMFAYISGSPFVFMEFLHVSPKHFAWLFGLNAIGLIGASQINRRLLAVRSPARITVTVALFPVLAGAVLVGLAVTGTGSVPTIAPALFVFLLSLGFVLPNSTAMALEAHGSRAGVASSVLGSTQYAISATASSLVGLLNDGTLWPMAAVMGTCAVATWVTALLTLGREKGGTPVHQDLRRAA
ncbi:multidrug effflux MFS transporter [Hyalangium rubrum]|uniref:Multidrug effflux MFS transporter n=1 Tax=Hyalangium rubrum TaxID=3103134 RepID=A0ABU5GW00_9BACT|nr:multidrug effflux MFS transporter [Hyalangium sp. s54d21]MDY7225368.1 multidrug effflux MFS transporter [Hyalangium sp. s54d21]